MKLNINKSSWKKIQFGDVVKKISNKINPSTHDSEIVIQGGHINKRDFHIREFDNKKELGYLGPAFHIGFKKKQILYVSRNPHLMKVGYPYFDGICSNTTYVMETKDNNILRNDLIPFIMHSDKFIEQSVANVRGGVNPYVNWGDLAIIKFPLPSKEQQAEISKLLWAMDDVIEKEFSLLKILEELYQSLVDSLFSKKNDNFDYVRLDKISSINSKSLKSNTDPSYRFRYLDISSIIEPKVIGKLNEMTFSEAPGRAKRIVENNSIILSMVRPYQKSFVYVTNGENIIASTGTSVINVKIKDHSKFVFHQFFSENFNQYCKDHMSGTNYPAITPKNLEQFKIAIPRDTNEISKITDQLNHISQSITDVKFKKSNSKLLLRNLINQVFNGI